MNQVRDYELKRQQRLAVMTTLVVVVRQIPVLATAGAGGYLAVTGRLSPGGLFAFLYLLHFLVDSLSGIPGLLLELRSAGAAAARIAQVIQRPTERKGGNRFAGVQRLPAVAFRDVVFSYGDQAAVLDGVDFGIPHQRTVALVGPSGGGKSTVFKLLCGFYEPERGSVDLYGHALREWSLEAARAELSLVAQDTYLFPATVAENISLSRPGASIDDVVEAAKMANAHEFIAELPQGYDTPVGERGSRLSGGERQRIGIARAILKDAPILLLDEPTSALDARSEALVEEALERFTEGRTVLVIAHRLSTIRSADEIVVLDGGRIVERGAHEDLMQRGGVYKQLYLKQAQTGSLAAGTDR